MPHISTAALLALWIFATDEKVEPLSVLVLMSTAASSKAGSCQATAIRLFVKSVSVIVTLLR